MSRNPQFWLFLILIGSLSVAVTPFAFSSTVDYRSAQRAYESVSCLLSSSISKIDGLLSDDDFDRFCAIDETIQNLKEQLPSTLLRPLTTLSADKVYEANLRLTVLVPKSNNNNDDDEKEGEQSENGEITLLQSRDELVSLSDVLVLATSAAQQARTLLSMSPGRNAKQNEKGDSASLNSDTVQCQLVMDDTLNCIRIPWKTQVPLLAAGSTTIARLEGLSELLLNSTSGKVHTHRLRSVTWNGRSINGPEIGQALRAIQSASLNFQKAPRLPQFESNKNNAVFWKELRDGILEQAATAAAASSKKQAPNEPKPTVYAVNDVQSIRGWMHDTSHNVTSSSAIPLPGNSEWKDYAAAHECLLTFCDQRVPMLAGTDGPKSASIDPNVFFTPNVTFAALDGSIVMTGSDLVASFYRSLSLARRGTGQRWTVTRSSVLDWRKRSLAIDYDATNALPPRWHVKGRDMYILNKIDTPIVQQIRQLDFQANSADGNLVLDSTWLMNNLVGAVKRSHRAAAGGGGGVINMGEVFSDLLLQQGGTLSSSNLGNANGNRNKISKSAAANIYYLMSTLLEQSSILFAEKSEQILPPGADFLQDNVELNGYLGETLVRGRNAYNRLFRTIISGTRQSVAEKLLVVEDVPPPRVELVSEATVRLFLAISFRIPPPRLLSNTGGPSVNAMLGVPLKIELVSDYAMDSTSGLVTKHTLIETRVNGKLTPGDVLSRSMNRFLKMDSMTDKKTSKTMNGNDDFFANFADTMAWLSKQRPSAR